MNKQAQLQAALNEYRTLCAKPEWTEEDETRADQLKADMAKLRRDIDRENRRAGAGAEADEIDQFLNGVETELRHNADPTHPGQSAETREADKEMRLAVAQVRKRSLKNFRGEKAGETAYRCGMFLMATLGGNEKAREFCKAQGIEIRVHRESDNSAGGILVPTEFDNEIIDLREDYGVIRRLAKLKKMTSNTLTVKRREGGLQAFAVGEGKKITESEKKWGEVDLKARKFAVLARMTSELNADAVINLADDFAGEMAEAFAEIEDACAFIGDGSAAYHNIFGIIPRLKGLSGTVANIGGLALAGGNTWDEIQAADFTKLLGRMPGYVFKFDPRWFCTSQFYFSVIEREIDKAGGTSRTDLVDGRPMFKYKGFPVEFVTVMDAYDKGNSSVPLLFGAPAKGVMFGDRQATTLAMTNSGVVDGESLFEIDEEAIRAIERIDINVHDVGNADADPAKRKAGPIGGLILAAA
jgi:HK97 family phage major capsid protein